jgi:hypothetical protein
VVVTKGGEVELCSAPPCPVLDLEREYDKQLAANPDLQKRLTQARDLAKTHTRTSAGSNLSALR